jgi:CTLH/CRA C-terminal to LisH motif domain
VVSETCSFLQILDEQPALVFRVQQQQLIELIRAGKIDEALDFAQEYLAYKGEANADLLDELGASPPGDGCDGATLALDGFVKLWCKADAQKKRHACILDDMHCQRVESDLYWYVSA